MNLLQQFKCFVFDMDGTIYLSSRVIPGAKELFKMLDERNIPYFFFTNNSSRSPKAYIEKLERLGFGSYKREKIITSGDVTVDYIKKTFGSSPSVYLVGTPSLHEHFESSSIRITSDETPDCLVVGFDTTYNFEKASKAVDLLREGVPFLATNVDAVCPLDGGDVLPDCASMCAMLTHATGRKPKFLGKPSFETAQYIKNKAGVQFEEIAVVGDRLYTDMHLAMDNGMCAIGVLSGEMTQADIDASEQKPSFVFDSVADLHKKLL
ncbi:MAG: HAD-IIA family hydrolase [Clostridia bacterium]|jgi:HAD superfamily hydrolase (TIGR01450 family)|nr:HAD-IIA family hydrolase [Clostridia bacterium]